MVRRVDDDEKDDWRKARGQDIERFGIWIIGGLIVIVSVLIGVLWSQLNTKLDSIDLSIKEIQSGQAGIMRENQIQDEKIQTIKSELDNHIKSLERDRVEYEALRQDYYRRFGYVSTTRGGNEVLLNKPIKDFDGNIKNN